MIDKYSDHAANERTFLSWVRTAIAIVGFGLVVVHLGGGGADSGTTTSGKTGMPLVFLGMALVIASAVRFLMIRKLIRSSKIESVTPVLLDLALAIVLVAMISTLAGFGIHVSNVF
jgi:putative membrane protein